MSERRSNDVEIASLIEQVKTLFGKIDDMKDRLKDSSAALKDHAEREEKDAKERHEAVIGLIEKNQSDLGWLIKAIITAAVGIAWFFVQHDMVNK